DPFFTTKEQGQGQGPEAETVRGTGLGLATIYGVVRLAGGHIGVESEVGRGTCFTILLPLVVMPSVSAAPLEHAEQAAPGAVEGRILLVDDDDSVRRTVEKILLRGGYQVVSCTGPEAALAKAGEDRDFDLVVTDVIMPQMSGPALVERLLALLGPRPVVFLSGYASAAQSMLGGHAGFLPKPFTPAQLLAKVRAQLQAGLTDRARA
ncbi:MAG: response regulator, partial [Myxococcales bacterium]|nr:response regulator [Myxococcales bacterium]